MKRNIKRFPEDFMFELNKDEFELSLRSQFVTLKKGEEEYDLKSQNMTSSHGGRRTPIKAFTEQGIAMLSSVLNSEKAILINIQIIRAFIKLREMIDSYTELREKVEELEKNNETNFKEIFRVIRLLITKEEKPKNKIGFNTK